MPTAPPPTARSRSRPPATAPRSASPDARNGGPRATLDSRDLVAGTRRGLTRSEQMSSSAPVPASRPVALRLLLGVPIVAAAFAYGTILTFGFVWDDHHLIVDS